MWPTLMLIRVGEGPDAPLGHQWGIEGASHPYWVRMSVYPLTLRGRVVISSLVMQLSAHYSDFSDIPWQGS